MRALLLILASLALVGCNDKAARSSEDILVYKQFYAEAVMRMGDLKRETFLSGDLTFDQLRTLTPRDPDWRDAQFLVLSSGWGRTNIICASLILSAGARWCGASRWLAMGLPTGPAFAAFIYYAIRHDLEFGPHGGIVPAWVVAGIVLLVVTITSFIGAIAVRGRES